MQKTLYVQQWIDVFVRLICKQERCNGGIWCLWFSWELCIWNATNLLVQQQVVHIKHKEDVISRISAAAPVQLDWRCTLCALAVNFQVRAERVARCLLFVLW